MKFLAFFLIATLAAVLVSADSPSQITGNNVGDLVSVDINAKANIDNNVDVGIFNVLLKFLSRSNVQVGGGDGINLPNFPPLNPPEWPVLPERN
jgi:hypothetical protein